MAITVECRSCGLEFSVPEAFAGKTGKCRRCNAPITVPDAATPAAGVSPSGSSTVAPAAFVPAPPPAPFLYRSDSDEYDALRNNRREPWYFQALVVLAWVFVVVVSFAILIQIVMTINLWVEASRRPANGFGHADSLMTLVMVLLWVVEYVVTFLFGALVLLGVDVGRSLRMQRSR